MTDKKKKIIIGTIIIVIILILVIALILFNTNKNKDDEQLQNIELTTELLDAENIENLDYETEITNEQISSKYSIGKEKYEVKADVMIGEGTEKIEGKMIYIRGNYNNLNIYKTEYKLNKYKDKNMQISNILQQFETICESYIGLLDEYEQTEQLYGESTVDYERPIEESIYYDGRLYSKTFKNEEKQYDINYYKSGESIICELVRVL